MALPKELRRFLQQSAIWTLLCFATEAICRWELHWPYPYGYPSCPRSDMFGDFRLWIASFAHFHSKLFFDPSNRLMYPAPVAVSYKFFLLAGGIRHPHFATQRFIAIIIATSLVVMFLLHRALVRRGMGKLSSALFLLATYLMSFPFWFEIHQGNMEFAVWIIVLVGLWAFWTKRFYVAATFFGVAISMKIFPFVFLGLFIARKQFREAFFTLFATAITTLVSLWLVCPDIAYSFRQTNLGVDQFRQIYVLHHRPVEVGFDHSLFGLFKRLLPRLPAPERLGHLLLAYLAVVAIAGILIFFVRIRKLPVVNQILCLSVAAILLPPTSFDYTLLHLYAPFALLVFVVLERRTKASIRTTVPGLYLAFVLMAFVLSAQSEFIHHGLRYGGQIKAVALLAVFVVGLIYPFQMDFEGERNGKTEYQLLVQRT